MTPAGPAQVESLTAMGFEEDRVHFALEATGATNLEILAGWLLENADRPLLPVFPAVFLPARCLRPCNC